MADGVKFEATRAAIERARIVFPRQIYDHIVNDILAAVAFDEGCVSEKLAELQAASERKPNTDDFDGGEVLR